MDDDIAIVGVGCRFPGADNLDEFWRVLVNGENHVKEIPKDRWDNDAFFDEDKDAPGKSYVRKAGLLNRHDEWDNRLFGVSDLEAARVDPQQRYVLECVHMAMEDGGITRAQLNGSETGVYIGCMNDDYKIMGNSNDAELTSYSATGMSTSVIAARVSYVYNLQGPCLSLDTACSSALMAVHLGSQAIRAGDCEQAICGGVSSIISPDTFLALCKARMMSPTGQCQTFCDTADGYARGEGCGVVILKSLNKARKQGNKIWGIIQTGTNQDGHAAQPITAPSGNQQRNLLSKVYKNGVNPATVQYIEAHGTGTSLGDPTEVNALGEFFSGHRGPGGRKHPLLVGSVKSNIGHTESAAGVAGLIKVLLMMKHGKMVPTLHVKKDKSNINKKLRLEELGLDLCIEAIDWKQNTENTRVACVNSFGFGGSNCHAVVTQFTHTICQNSEHQSKQETNYTICISAIDKRSLEGNIRKFEEDLHTTAISLSDIASTSCLRRDHLACRMLLVGKTREELVTQCRSKLSRLKNITPATKRNIVFVYCGVGTTWTGMCKEMMANFDVFRKAVEEIDHHLLPLTQWKIADRFNSDSSYDDPFINHIAIFAAQVALTEVWKSLGIKPDVIVGQSVGEVAAAYTSGHLSLKDAVHVIYHRSRILAQLTGGSMMVVGNLPMTTVEDVCKKYSDTVAIAVYSSPVSCVLSGNSKDIQLIKTELETMGNSVFIMELKVHCAYHSPQVEESREKTLQHIGKFPKSKIKKLPQISTVTAELAAKDDFLTGQYWADNIRKPVLFMQAIRKSMVKDAHNIFVELGPRPVLRTHLPNILDNDEKGVCVASMNANKELSTFWSTVAELYQIGSDINWTASFKCLSEPSPIPRYQFNRTKQLYIPEKVKAHLSGLVSENNASHMFVTCRSKSQTIKDFQVLIDERSTPFVYDHFLDETVVVPGATYIEAGFHIGQECLQEQVYNLMVSAEFTGMFMPSPGLDHVINVETKQRDPGKVEFVAESNSRMLCSGKVSTRNIPDREPVEISTLISKCPKMRTKEESYACLGAVGFRYGHSLSFIQRSWASETECMVELEMPASTARELLKTHFHPSVIDAIFQVFGMVDLSSSVEAAIPQGVGAIVFNRPPQRHMFCYAVKTASSQDELRWNALLLSPEGFVIAEVHNFYAKSMTASKSSHRYHLTWNQLHISKEQKKVPSEMHFQLMSSEGNQKKLEQKLLEIGNVKVIQSAADIGNITDKTRSPDAIIFHVTSKKDTEIGTMTLMNAAIQTILELKQILIGLSSSLLSVPLFVVTESTQSIHGREKINLAGAELWGMVRAVRHEAMHSDIRLLDIDPDDVDVDALGRVLRNDMPQEQELCISGAHLFGARCQHGAINRLKHERIMKMDRSYHAILSSSHKSVIYSPVFHVTCKDCPEGPPIDGAEFPRCWPFAWKARRFYGTNTTVTLRLDAITLHNQAVFPITEDSSGDKVWCDEKTKQGFHVIALEGRGTTTRRKRQNNTVFCFPVLATTTVTVPEECSMQLSLLPSYTPGILITTSIIYHCINEIPPKSTVVVLHSWDDRSEAKPFCTKLIYQRKCKAQFITTTDAESSLPGEPKIVLVLTRCDAGHINTLMDKAPSLQNIVTAQCVFPDKLQTWTKYKYPQLEITMLTTSTMFSTKTLQMTMPRVFGLLKSLRPAKPSIERNRTYSDGKAGPLFAGSCLHCPMKELNIEDALLKDALKFKPDRKSLFFPNACYIVIGGLTGLGWELLKLLADMHAGYIATFSRKRPTESRLGEIKVIMKIRSCKITCIQADISDRESIERGMKRLQDELLDVPIKGVFHGAAVLADALLVNQTVEQLQIALQSKIQGTWNLHSVTKDMPLDFFVMHSSIVSLIGNAGQTNYAAGNSFQDTLAFYRRANGQCAQVINWGVLSVGMTVDNPTFEKQLEMYGFGSLGVEQIREFFIEALLTNEVQTCYADINWKTALKMLSFSTQKAKFEKLVSVDVRSTRDFRWSALAQLTVEERKCKVTSLILTVIGECFVVDKDMLNDSSTFVELGVESLSAMIFVNAVHAAIECKIPFVMLLSDTTTVATIVDFLLSKMANTNQHGAEDMNLAGTDAIQTTAGTDVIQTTTGTDVIQTMAETDAIQTTTGTDVIQTTQGPMRFKQWQKQMRFKQRQKHM